jgi:FKBP-type peptidyl-prolyl cis-trans isomerase (trigger factor)
MASKKAKKHRKKQPGITSNVARSSDGTIQINFIIPKKLAEKTQDTVIKELAKNIELPGFRKGKAPVSKVKKQVPKNTLIEQALNKILPQALADAIKVHKITPAIYPKIELISADDNKDWQVRATTCNLPDVNLGDYKKIIKGEIRAKSIWTPDKGGKKEEKRELSQAEKQNLVIDALLQNINVDIPDILIQEEVNSKLSKLLERIEKLGLDLDSYLASIGKTTESLREEYKKQANNSIKLELVLSKIAEEENIEVKEDEIKEVVKASGTSSDTSKILDSPEQKRIILSILRRRKALDYLANLI